MCIHTCKEAEISWGMIDLPQGCGLEEEGPACSCRPHAKGHACLNFLKEYIFTLMTAETLSIFFNTILFLHFVHLKCQDLHQASFMEKMMAFCGIAAGNSSVKWAG